jgi:phosphoglycolate phosphatase
MAMARIAFDLDGTLVDSAPDLQGIANRLLAQRGLAPVLLPEARSFIGQGVAVFVAKLRAARGIPEEEQTRVLSDFLAQYDDAVMLTQPYPGVAETLDRLRRDGHLLALCTNKPMRPTMALLRHLGFEHHFTRILAGDSLPQHKPDPAPLLAAFQMGDSQMPCLYIGDSEVDAETARRARVPFLLFTEGYRATPVADLPHRAAFSAWSGFAALISGLVEG